MTNFTDNNITTENGLSLVPTRQLVTAMPAQLSAPGVNLGAYINTVHQIPILSSETEHELATRYFNENDLEAARLLVMSHLRFVIHIARSYSGYGLHCHKATLFKRVTWA